MSSVEIEHNLTANYEVEEYTYFSAEGNPISVSVRSATSTVGSSLVDEDRDRTGIMIWPATHLLCQYLCSREPIGRTIIELGCGCGLVGTAAAVAFRAQKQTGGIFWVSTDMDEKALEICRENHVRNGIDECSSEIGTWTVRNLRWGNSSQIDRIQKELSTFFCDEPTTAADKFDAIVAADIVYPAMSEQILRSLMETASRLLREDGIFWLSFATRDGHRTPTRLIEAASTAGFEITCIPTLDELLQKKLPPLLDARILKLRSSNEARARNDRLGESECSVFPGLRAAAKRAEEESSEEEWDAPFTENDFEDFDEE